ncbi:Carboxymethylenebutenolidase, partial [mine drainage metagenome]
MDNKNDDRDPGSIFDAHLRAEFVDRDVEATMATMSDQPYLTHVPVMTGGYGTDQVRDFYSRAFIGHWPSDTTITPISRTIGQGRVVDEFVV